MNAVIDCLDQRQSLRTYAKHPVSAEHLELILHSALRAPTAGNMMLYTILQITDPEKKRILSRTCDNQPFIAKAPLVLVFLADLQRWFDYYRLNGVAEYCKQHNLEFRGPEEADLLLAGCDALIAAQNAVVAAESLGIGSCYIGDIMENYEQHSQVLNLPPWAFPITMLCMGYYPEGYARPRTERFDRKFVVAENEYTRLTYTDFLKMFERYHNEFNEHNPFQAQNHAQLMYARKTGADFSLEMARSVRAALKNWQGEPLD